MWSNIAGEGWLTAGGVLLVLLFLRRLRSLLGLLARLVRRG